MEPWEQAAQAQKPVDPIALEPWEQAANAAGPDFMQRMSTDFNKRVAQGSDTLTRLQNGETSIPGAAVQLIGNGGAGLALDTIGNIVGSGARYAGDALGLNTLDATGVTPLNKIGGDVQDIGAQTGINKALSYVGNKINQASDYVENNYPDAASTAGAIGNIVGIMPVAKFAKSGFDAAEAAYNARRLNAVQQMIMPKQTAAEIAENAKAGKYTSEGLLNTRTYNPSPSEIEQAKVIAALPVKPSAPVVDNINIIKAAQAKRAQEIGRALDQSNVAITPQALAGYSQSIADNITNNPMLNPHSATVNSLLMTAQKYIDENPKTAAGLWNARKQFDQHVLNFQPGSLDTDAASKAYSFTAKQIRNGMNQAIIDSAPNAAYAKFLQDYTHMSNAVQDMSTNVAGQGSNAIERFLQTKKGKAIVKGAKAIGIGGAGIGGYLGIKNAITKSGESNDSSSKDGGD